MPSLDPYTSPILVVDDDRGLLFSIKTMLLSRGFPEPVMVSDSREVMKLVRRHQFRLVLLDLMMPHVDGLTLLKDIKRAFPNVECIIITARDEVDTAVSAIRRGAYAYLVKPLDPSKLIETVQKALGRVNLPIGFADLADPEAFAHMVAEDEAMALVFHKVEVVAPTDYSVVLTGESGTGKEMVARTIHQLSPRRNGPFLAVNVAAVNRNLFEDEFFGHVKGAYTHAVSDRPGFFETARGGTLFLDEITELNIALQGKLLRVLQEKEFYRVGSTRSRDMDVRILAATNHDIDSEVKAERFRSDLFFRLNMYTISIKPLKERVRDILPLARHFLKIHGKYTGKHIEALSPELERRLLTYAFPGNVRELEHMIATAVLSEKGTDLGATAIAELNPTNNPDSSDEEDFSTLSELEKQHIQTVLDKTKWDRKQTAEILGINLATVYRKIKKYHLKESPFPPEKQNGKKTD